jgi:hypothetical protein
MILIIEHITGDVIIADVDKSGVVSSKNWILNNPLSLVLNEDGTKYSIIPFKPMANKDIVEVHSPDNTILFSYEPAEKFAEEYRRVLLNTFEECPS